MATFDKRDFLRLLSSAAIAAPTAALVSKSVKDQTTPSVYDRVMKTRTIRCGYDIWPPIIIKNINTSQISGIFYDYAETLGRNLDLKIEWVPGVTYANYISELQYGHIDAMCAGIWPIGSVIAAVDFTDPLYYVTIDAYVRKGNTRFDGDISILNDPRYTIANIDGLIPARVAAQDFPKAKTLSLPQTAPSSDMLISVATGKADATFTDAITADDFMKNNPDTLQKVPLTAPIRIFGNTIAIAKNNEPFLRMLNNATEEMRNSFSIDPILNKYEPYPHSFLRIGNPYATQTAAH